MLKLVLFLVVSKIFFIGFSGVFSKVLPGFANFG